MTSQIKSLGVPIRLGRDDSSPRWGIAPNGGCRHQDRMRGVASKIGVLTALAVLAAGGSARAAEILSVSIAGSPADIGNVLIPGPSSASSVVTIATSGAVSLTGGAVRQNGGSITPLTKKQTVTLKCDKNPPANCSGAFKVIITAASASFATLGTNINITSPSTTGGASIASGALTTGTSGQQFFTINGATNGFTVTFDIGYSATLKQSDKNHTASWGYTVLMTR